MITKLEMRDLLRDKPLFAEFNDDEHDAFFDLLDPEIFGPGELIVKQDAAGDSMYLLVQGEAKVVHHRKGSSIDIALLKAGDFFGEIALVSMGPRSADVIAVQECLLLKITQAAVSALAGVYPSAAFKLLIAIGRLIVERLRQSNERYVDSLLIPTTNKGGEENH